MQFSEFDLIDNPANQYAAGQPAENLPTYNDISAQRQWPIPDSALTELLTMSEVAQYLRKSTGQVRRLFKGGDLPTPIYVGRTPMWPKATIATWIRGQVEKGGAQ